MTTETIFSATPETVTPVVPSATSITLPPEVVELVGQGKKYATPEDALKSVPHAQKHIKTLEEELAQAKAELDKRKTAEQLLDEIKSGIKPPESPSVSAVTPDTIAQVVSQQLDQRQQQQNAAQNIKQVTSAFASKFGDKAEEVYNSLAAETGLSVSQMNLLAATSPSAVLKLAGFTGKATPPAGKTSSDVNTTGMEQVTDPSRLSSRVRPGASSKEVTAAWRIAGQKVGKQPN